MPESSKVPDAASLNLFQVFVLARIAQSETKGAELRKGLSEAGCPKSEAAFANAMKRLENKGLLTGRFETASIDGMPVREKYFQITGSGQAILQSAQRLIQ